MENIITMGKEHQEIRIKESSISNFAGMVGESEQMRGIFKKITRVAATNSTVLIIGETGTGKELVAKSIHDLSDRRNEPYIKINCATFPAEIIESELFGHEKGAFTGAIDRRIGKFESANGGTIFLDEVSEMSLHLQAKLLRVLQEKEIERIGGNETIKLDVRIIAATNKPLLREINHHLFRADLFYRLNVFQILVPPLRKREGDIVLLAKFFLKIMSQKLKKSIHHISEHMLDRLKQHSWPGNVRELQHIIERAIILCNTSILDMPFELSNNTEPEKGLPQHSPLQSLENYQRDGIIRVLNHTKGKIRGEGGAAEILGIKPTTLDARMKKLGIDKRSFKID